MDNASNTINSPVKDLKVRQVYTSQVAHHVGAYPGFSGTKRLGVFLLPLDGMLVHRRVTPSIKFAGTHLYIWVERGTVRVRCPVQEHNTMSPARARTRTARSGASTLTMGPPRLYQVKEKGLYSAVRKN